jgi:hypothetical protein
MKIIGIILIVLAMLQAYLWIFEFISINGAFAQGCYFIIICFKFICGLLATDIIYIK